MTAWVALLRGVGPRSHKKMSMADLRQAVSKAGLANATTLLATGNLLFESDKSEEEIHSILSGVIGSFDLNLPVVLRRSADLVSVLGANPYPDAAAERPSQLLVMFLDEVAEKLPPPGPNERFAAVGREVFLDYKDGVSASKVPPGTFDKKIGRVGTTRNWNTLQKLVEAGP